jgi:hypothetical protein
MFFSSIKKDRNLDRNFLTYVSMKNWSKTPLLQPKFLVNFFNNIYPNWENSDNKQRSQKTFAYGDTFAKKRL